jgi:hypothetical protein
MTLILNFFLMLVKTSNVNLICYNAAPLEKADLIPAQACQNLDIR